MKTSATLIVLMLLLGAPMRSSAAEKSTDSLCSHLRQFLDSVPPDQDRAVTLHTVWGDNFKDDSALVMGAKRCSHGGYGPGEVFCDFLMESTSTEFADINTKAVLACLLGGEKIPKELEIQSGSFSVEYGSGERGAFVDVVLAEDQEMGGMALRISASGY